MAPDKLKPATVDTRSRGSTDSLNSRKPTVHAFRPARRAAPLLSDEAREQLKDTAHAFRPARRAAPLLSDEAKEQFKVAIAYMAETQKVLSSLSPSTFLSSPLPPCSSSLLPSLHSSVSHICAPPLSL